MDEGAFEGVRVVELAQWVLSPVARCWPIGVPTRSASSAFEGDPYRGLTHGIEQTVMASIFRWPWPIGKTLDRAEPMTEDRK